MTEEIWTTRDGRQIPVGELNEEHAKNIIRMMIRARRKLQERFEKSPTRGHMIAMIVRPYLKELDRAEEAKNAELEEEFHRQLYDDVFGSEGMWGSD